MTLLVLFGVLFAILLTGLPIFSGISLTALIFAGWAQGSITGLMTIFVGEISSYLLVAIALFSLMANLMVKIKAVDDLFNFAHVTTRHLPGGLGVAAILTCTIFAAIIGSSIATALTVGAIAVPQMIRFGYSKARACGVVAGGATLGILIPPSGPMILYSLVTDASVGALFMAGIIPGLILALAFAILHMGLETLSPESKIQLRASWREILQATRSASVSLALPVIILGGIYGGFFTATEAAAVGVVGALLIGFLWYRNLGLRDIFEASFAAAMTSAMILMIVGASAIFSNIITLLRLPNEVLQAITDMGLGQFELLLLIMGCLIILGMFLEGVAIILITTPVVLPALLALDIDLVWYGVLLVIALELSLLTPPVGMNLFVMQAITSVKLASVIKGATPYIITLLVFLLVVILLPQIVIFLPQIMGYS